MSAPEQRPLCAGVSTKSINDTNRSLQSQPQCSEQPYNCTKGAAYIVVTSMLMAMVGALARTPLALSAPNSLLAGRKLSANRGGFLTLMVVLQVVLHAILCFFYIEQAQDRLRTAGPYCQWERAHKMLGLLVRPARNFLYGAGASASTQAMHREYPAASRAYRGMHMCLCACSNRLAAGSPPWGWHPPLGSSPAIPHAQAL